MNMFINAINILNPDLTHLEDPSNATYMRLIVVSPTRLVQHTIQSVQLVQSCGRCAVSSSLFLTLQSLISYIV